MTNDEYERIKAEEKAHLRKVKALKKKVRRLRRTQKTTEAAAGLRRAQEQLDMADALIRTLDEESAHAGARFGLALEASDAASHEAEEDAARDLEARARDLVSRLRAEMQSDDDAPAARDNRPDKTIGRSS